MNPATRKRIQRFWRMRRASGSLIALVVLFVISLGAELLCNNRPLLIHKDGQFYFPFLFFYPDDVFTGSGLQNRPDYKALAGSAAFTENSDNWICFAPIPFGPHEIIDPASIDVPAEVRVTFHRPPRVGTINVRPDLTVAKHNNVAYFFGGLNVSRGTDLTTTWSLPENIREGIATRFANQAAPPITGTATAVSSNAVPSTVSVSLSTYRERRRKPRSVRLTLREIDTGTQQLDTLVMNADLEVENVQGELWGQLSTSDREQVRQGAQDRLSGDVEPMLLEFGSKQFEVRFAKTDVHFPFRPVRGHPLGLDSAGRDVLVRLLYGLRTAMSFALALVLVSMVVGTMVGAVQGYWGGLIDITGQRMIEVWSALPFLYIMILMGSLFGRGFFLLLICYGVFNWIGISYYMRAEFLRLRQMPYVDAARCLGLSAPKIIVRHILPNAMVPIVTFLPFSLVGAIGILTALDYLGFGLPPPTPSWGELLSQAQEFAWAWWLVVYPSTILFVVMLLGVFVGEGLRAAYDPKRFVRLR